MKLFKAIKLGYKVLKAAKKNKKDEPIFGDNPDTYGVTDLEEEKMLKDGNAKHVQIKTYFPEAGGSFTQVGDEKEPFPGIPNKKVVSEIATLKRMIPAGIDAYYQFLVKHQLHPTKYCRSVREVYRLFNVMISRETQPKLIERWTKVRDMICVMLEFDSAYRFRFQDMIVEANMEELRLHKGDRYWAEEVKSYKWGHLDKKEEPNVACACHGLKDHENPDGSLNCQCDCHKGGPKQ